MKRKLCIVCAMLFASAFVAAANPITCKEIAMLLRNGEKPQSVREEIARRKLLMPLTAKEEAELASLGAPYSLLSSLKTPAMLASPEVAASYQASLLERQRIARQQQKEEELRTTKAAATPPGSTPGPGKETAGKPLAMRFVSMDGTVVDLANMRGKVVLIDFWATWCGPCMMEVPDVVAAYNKYHDRGFEIIGISLDKDRDAVLRTIQARGMPWPQFFDGKGWKSDAAVACNIHTLPARWLLNKAGVLVNAQARGNLDSEIEKLLAE